MQIRFIEGHPVMFTNRSPHNENGNCSHCGCPWQAGRTPYCDEQACCHDRPSGLRALIAERQAARVAALD